MGDQDSPTGDDGYERALIQRWLRPNPHRPSEMVLDKYGTAVWAIVGHARGMEDDIAGIARAYNVPEDAVRAALAYYRRHPLQIDAKLEANAAWHAS
jgi:uncharacterized protein (DUF433 family)